MRTDADARLLYVATTRAKNSLIIHDNRGIYKSVSDDIAVIREYDSHTYHLPETLELIWSLKDVQLGGFKFFKTARIIDTMKTGDQLVSGEVIFESGTARGLNASTGENILLYSREFTNKLDLYESKGYAFASAKVEYIVYWYNDELEEEYKIVLPRILLRRSAD